MFRKCFVPALVIGAALFAVSCIKEDTDPMTSVNFVTPCRT